MRWLCACVALLFVAGTSACSGCRGGKGAGDSGGDATATASASASSSSATTMSAGPSSNDEAWVQARSGDPLELARLADAVPTDDLARVAGDDGASEQDREAAIRALAFVPDPTPALPALSKIVIGASVERSTIALETIAEIAPVRAPTEEAEPPAWKDCAVALLAALKTLPGSPRRALAIRALLGLADRGAIDRDLVPRE